MNATNPIHVAHRNGLTQSLCQALALGQESLGQKLLRVLVEPGVTYAELVSLKERAIVRAVDRFRAEEKLEISESRVDYLLDLFHLVSPDRKVCSKCGSWDLSLKAGTWSVVTQAHCVQCDTGVYNSVCFTQGPVSWVNGETYAIGVDRDENRYPLTVEALHETLSFRGQVVDPVILSTMSEVDPSGTLNLIHLCRWLHTQGEKLSPESVLGALTLYTIISVDQVALKTLLMRVFSWVGFAQVYDDQTGEPKLVTSGAPKISVVSEIQARDGLPRDPVEPRVFRSRFRKLLADSFPAPREAQGLCSTLQGFQPSRVDWGGAPESLWFGVLDEVEKCGSMRELLIYACQERPNIFNPLWDCYLDVPTLARKFYRLTSSQGQALASRLLNRSCYGDSWSMFDQVIRHGKLVDLARAMETQE